MTREQGSDGFAIGFLLGAFVGAVLALLFAPASGRETRSQIRDRSIELKDRAEVLGEEATRRAEELRICGQEMVEEQKTRFQEAITEGQQAAARKKEELLSQLESSTRGVSRSVELTDDQAEA